MTRRVHPIVRKSEKKTAWVHHHYPQGCHREGTGDGRLTCFAEETFAVYRDKYVVEICFMRLKNNIDLCRLHIHNVMATQNKLLIGFITTVLMSKMNKIKSSQGLYKPYTMKEMLKILDRQRIHEIRGQRILTPPTCEQKISMPLLIEPPS